MTFTKLPKAITAEELLSTPLPPVKWIIPGLLPAGLALFAGPSKAGKSWLTLWLCLQVAQGKSVWGREVEPRTVLYLSLEDTLNRLQDRLFRLVGSEDLSKEMCQLLKAWRKECEWDRQQTANETVSEDDYLFRQPNGKPMCPSTFTYRFKLILKANNLPLDLSVHSLRHTNASLLIAQGVDVRTVASLLGHAQASTTLDIYAHAFDKNKRKAQEKLGKAIGL